jgi:hypothetical protein
MARLFTVATDETLINLIHNANERLVIVAPGLSEGVATALVERLQLGKPLSELSITMDTDPEVCRLGYGEIQAVDMVREALALLEKPLHTQTGVRIGLIVADDDVLVYSPTPQLIEAGSTSEEKPNAIRITGAGPQELSFACGGKETSDLGFIQEVGLRDVSDQAVAEAKADLEANPPRRFDLVRLERVFNYKLEFVEFSIDGCRLNSRVVSLPADILGLAEKDLQERLRNTFKVFEAGVPFSFEIEDPDDASRKIKLTEEYFAKEAKELRKKLKSLGTYGSLIQKRHKPSFEAGIERLRNLLTIYADLVKANIAAKIKETRDGLVESLHKRVKVAPPKKWLDDSLDGTLDDAALLSRLEHAVDEAFLSVEESFDPSITCIFKGVHYETITQDPKFRERVEQHFSKDDAAKLLFEYNASRAEEPTHA